MHVSTRHWPVSLALPWPGTRQPSTAPARALARSGPDRAAHRRVGTRQRCRGRRSGRTARHRARDPRTARPGGRARLGAPRRDPPCVQGRAARAAAVAPALAGCHPRACDPPRPIRMRWRSRTRSTGFLRGCGRSAFSASTPGSPRKRPPRRSAAPSAPSSLSSTRPAGGSPDARGSGSRSGDAAGPMVPCDE